jgi:hypothetical protein
MCGVRVRVYRVTAYNDPETGRPGKLIELVEVRRREGTFIGPGVEEALMAQRLIQGVFIQLQGLGLVPPPRDAMYPKITLILSEEEYERLGVRFEVNEEFDLEFKDGKISFNPI